MTDTALPCPACQRTFDAIGAMVTRPTKTAGLTQHGIQCPHCRFFYHTHYLSDELMQLRSQAAKAAIIYGRAQNARTKKAFERAKAAYQAAFERLNPEKVAA